MSDNFENFVPKVRGKNDSTRANINVFSEGKKKATGPDYTVQYGDSIDGIAYNKPGIRSYNLNAVDKKGKILYTGQRNEFTYERPNEEYGKPPTLTRGNGIQFSDTKNGFFIDTTNLGSFLENSGAMKGHVLTRYGGNSEEYKTFEKTIIFTLADMQRVWTGDGNYNKDIVPTAGKVGKIQALKSAIKQLGKDIPSDETMFNQWSLGENPEKVICRDFSIVTARIAKKLGFEAIAGTIETGVSHAFTVMRSTETGQYYGVSADSVGGPSKVFEGNSLSEIRSSYQDHLLSLGRGQNFGGVFLDDSGKIVGKWMTDLERRRAKDFLGGDTPSRLLDQSLGTDYSLNRGNIGKVDYTSLIVQKGRSIEGEVIDTDTFFRGGITRMSIDGGGSTAFDVGMGTKLSSKSLEISSGFTARAYVAADINLTIGKSEEKGTQVPYISGNSVIGGQMKYENKKWTFTTDLGKSYELSGPNQMQRPLIKLLPSGEYAIFSGEYKGESMNILGRAVMENYFATQRRELSLGLRTEGGTSSAVFVRNTKDKIPGFPIEGTRELGLGVGGSFNKTTDWKVEAAKKRGPTGNDTSISAGISVKF